MTISAEATVQRALGPDRIAATRWLAAYALLLAAALTALAWLVAGQTWEWSWRGRIIARNLAALAPAVKLLALGIYLSMACTFLPLNTGVVVAAVAMQQANLAPDIWSTDLLVAVVVAAASTIANINDYHIFTLLLRHRRVAAVRNTRFYQAAARWFAVRPFGILMIFNIIPVPVDVVRMLAVSCRYRRGPFGAANFLGRFIRYAAIAAVTYSLGEDYGWLAVVGLLGLAVVLALVRVIRRPGPSRAANEPAPPENNE